MKNAVASDEEDTKGRSARVAIWWNYKAVQMDSEPQIGRFVVQLRTVALIAGFVL
jgi:hypothetical protein